MTGGDRPPGTDVDTADSLIVQAVPTWWDGSPVSQTLDAVLYKGQTMPEKNRFPAVPQPIELYSIMPMNSGKDYKARKVEVAQPLMAGGPVGGPVGGNQGGDFVVQSVALRGRDGGATAELGGDAAYALRAAAGGGSDPYVLAPILDAAKGRTDKRGSRDGSGIGDPADPMFTLRAGSCHGIVSVHGTQDPDINIGCAHTLGRNHGQENALFSPTMAVRRLMPIECHRLQGFPDNWCAVPTGPKGDKIAADGPQYKQLGNSWAVTHARWVGWRVALWNDYDRRGIPFDLLDIFG